ncbi:MAG: DUF3641 domain-containing protein [SAR324 cluster bacterium]|nr:DUF3641 domain-containing protein [SAR324 cluster bacterium]
MGCQSMSIGNSPETDRSAAKSESLHRILATGRLRVGMTRIAKSQCALATANNGEPMKPPRKQMSKGIAIIIVISIRPNRTGKHCLGCTAGAGSSCGGALT